MTTKQLIPGLEARRIVTAPKGSWKWQDAYRISTYHAYLLKNGRVAWQSVSQSEKFSEPQLRRNGFDDLPHGSLHNWPVSRREAVAVIGEDAVKEIEARGYMFSGN